MKYDLKKFKTDRSKWIIISDVEYGSTYQGTSDAESDHDRSVIVIPALEESLFRDGKMMSIHEEDVIYDSVESFISKALSGNRHSVTTLTAHMENGDAKFIVDVLRPLMDVYTFTDYIRANIRGYAFNVLNHMRKKIMEEPDGKTLVRVHTDIFVLEKLMTFIENFDDAVLNPLEFSKVTLDDRILSYKRLSSETVAYRMPHAIHAAYQKNRKLENDFRVKLLEIEPQIIQAKERMIPVEEDIRSRAAKFIIDEVVHQKVYGREKYE